MKKKISTTILLSMLIMSTAWADGDWDIYIDAVIEEGDNYNNVRVFDTPPDHTTLDMSGGSVDSLGAYNESTVNVAGGHINTLNAWEFSIVNVSGGFVYGMDSSDYTIINFSDEAMAYSVGSSNYGTVNITDGEIGRLGSRDFGIINLYGGIISESLGVTVSSTVNVYGYNLGKTDFGGAYGQGQVYGFWFDNGAFTIDLSGTDTFSRINLIPEPSSIILYTFSCLILRRKYCLVK